MAKLDLESSGESGGGYSDSFEMEESISLDPLESSTESDSKNAVVSQLKKTLSNGRHCGTEAAGSTNRTQMKSKTKTKITSQECTNNFKTENNKNHDVGSVDFGRTIRSPMRLINAEDVSKKTERPTSKFKQVAQNVRTMQSVVNTAKSFNDSLEVRDSVYGEWLARKSSLVSRERSSKEAAKRAEEEKKRKKEVEIAQRSTKAVQQWSASKEKQLQKMRKQKLQELEKSKEESKEIEEKKQSAEVASKKWREEKTRELITQQRQRKKLELEKMKEKEEEVIEKVQSASLAFDAWSKTKDEVIKKERQKQCKQKQHLKQAKVEQERERKDDSKKAFEAWKSKKDEKLSTTKTLFTYKEDGKKKVHGRAWCPARSMKHAYPKSKVTEAKSKTATQRTKSLDASYSTASFESTDADSETDSSIVDEGHSVSSRTSCKGVRKTIQVCCQTLEYWCTCERDV